VDLPHWEFVLLLVGVGLAAVAIAVPVAKGIRIAAGAFGAFMFIAAVAALFGFSGAALQWPITGIQSPILFPEPDSLKSPRPPLDAPALNGDWIHITLGSIEMGDRFFGQRGTQNNALGGMGFNSFFPVRIYLENGRIFVDATLYGGHPNYPPIVITHNQISPDGLIYEPEWDWNRNSRALEIVDKKQEPVFQLIYDPPNHIIVNGVFILPGDELITCDCPSAGAKGQMPRFMNLPPPALWSPAPPSPTILCPRLFKYPGWKHPGVLE
jgi:hypothetical protein